MSASPLLFVKRWTSLALWQIAVSLASERERERKKRRGGENRKVGRIIHSLCAQSAVEITQGNEKTPDRAGRGKVGEGGGWMWAAMGNSPVKVCTCTGKRLENVFLKFD